MSDEHNTEPQQRSGVQREPPQPKPPRSALVKSWCDTITNAKSKYQRHFSDMLEWQTFARGIQWPADQKDNYVVNITGRHVSQRVAALYAKNPTAVAHARERLDNTTWDGTFEHVQQSQQTLQLAMEAAPAVGADPAAMAAVQTQVMEAQAVLQDYQTVMQERRMRQQMGKTLELLYDYNVDEQTAPFKTMMKFAVRRALTNGVGWIKIGFQRTTRMTPDLAGRIRDMQEVLRSLEQTAADVADKEVEREGKEVEELRLQVQALQQEGELLLREGLTFDFPASTSIIPDPNCTHLKTLTGCSWVAQEYLLRPETIQQIWGIDVSRQYQEHKGTAENLPGSFEGAPPGAGLMTGKAGSETADQAALALVYQAYCKTDGLVYVVCDGYPEFLQEPTRPDVWLERFYPWFPIIFNEVDDEYDDPVRIFPPSDVEQIKHPQMEINRARESLREHRIANRPAYATATGSLEDADRDKLRDRPAHAILELRGLQPGQSVNELLQPVQNVPVDPALYNITPQFEDILRSGGLQEANLGGTSGATATESSIAAASLSVTSNSAVDDLDEVLTALARAGGQILLDNVSLEVVQRIVGRGAVWPQLSREEIARDLWLEVEAGSTGRPNQAQEIANAERLIPLLIQIPGIDPEFLGRELIRRMDDRLDLNQALASALPSIVAMNAMARPTTGDPATDPGQQGAAGGMTAQPGPAAGGQPGGVNVTTPAPSAQPPLS